MKIDLIAGFILSALIHLGILFGDKLIPETKVAKKVEVEEMLKIELVQMPQIEDEPEIIETNDDVKPLDLAPPMQQDVPQLAQPDSFVQKIQPPPPEGVTISATMNIVPEVRDPNMFRGMKVFDISMLDQIPVPKFQARPQYPFEMRRAGISGDVLVDFIVDTNGDVQNAYALRSSQREFEAAAVQAVSKWKFKAGRKGGRDVPTHMQVPIVFTLNEE
ncbi:MAG: energy transducer TonB [Verrucomicrobia bacterium]|nr:energy transducer TonB [Verrucomicrobiota bacterium]